MDPVLGASLVGGAFDLAGGLLGAKAERKAARKADNYNQQQMTAAFRYLQGLQGRDQLFGGLQKSALLQGQKAELGGFAGARKALDLGANVARQGVIQRGRQNQADTEQSLVGRGLIGTSTGAQEFAGVGDQTSAQLAAIDTQLAQAFADLGLQEGAVRGQHGQQLAGLEGQNRAIQNEIGFEMASLAPRTAKSDTEKLRNELYGTPFSQPNDILSAFSRGGGGGGSARQDARQAAMAEIFSRIYGGAA